MNRFDIIIIGSGPGGYTTAATAAAAGMNTAIIERDILGGTCLNRGCIPTKALCRCAEAAITVAESSELGINAGETTIDYPAMAARKDRIVNELRCGVETILKDVTVIHGTAKLTGQHTVEANGVQYTSPRIIIATGSRPAILPVPGAELAVTSDHMLASTELPPDIIIIGGGVIGLEFASIYNALGVNVTVIEYCKEILPPFDTDVAKRLRMAMKRRGVKFITSAKVTSLSTTSNGITAEYDSKGKHAAETARTVLMAVGRVPEIPDGATELGIRMNGKAIDVDSSMATSVDGIYAIGDVNGLCMLAHAAEVQGRVALGIQKLPSIIPSAVFTVPECAMAGLTEQQCTERHINIVTGQSTFRANGKAMAMGTTEGIVKVIAEKESGKILGVHICGANAADIIQEAVMAMEAGFSAEQAAETVFGHPTLSETLRDAFRATIKH